MKKIRNRILSGMMAVVLVVSLLAVLSTDTCAAPKYVKSCTRVYTLKEGQMYSIPLRMKQDSTLRVEVSIIDGASGERMYVIPQLWQNYEAYEGNTYSDEKLGLGSKMVDRVTLSGKALEGSKSAISLGVGFGGDVKVKVEVFSKQKAFILKNIVKETDEASD